MLCAGPGLAFFAPAAAAPPALKAIAIAEDQRRWSDGVLRGYLTDADPAVRVRAALAVGRLQDSTSVSNVLPLLDDRVPEVRREAIFALGQIGHRTARVALEARLRDPDPECVDLAIEALGKLGDRASTARITPFLAHSSARLRGDAAVALWRLADSTAVDALLARIDDPDPVVRWRVIYALEKVPWPDRIVLRVVLHLDDADPLVRAHAARTLGRQKSRRATAYLLQALDDPDPAVVVNALRGVQGIADTTCAQCPPRVARMLSHPDPGVRVTAATVLAERAVMVPADTASRRGVIEALTGHLKDPDAATRGACARSLLALRGNEALPEVTPLLTDSSQVVRVAALGALTRASAGRAAPVLLPRLSPATPLFERMTAAEALGTLKVREALPILRAGLADSALLFMASCAGALGEAGDSSSVPLLARTYAQRAGDADADARISIRDALRQLAGRAFADSVERAHPAKNAMPASYPDDFAEAPVVRGAIVHTSAGDIEWSFESQVAPQTVRNFVTLARRGYFDNGVVHRVVPDFVIQDGDPTGTGSGGPGYTIRCEYNRLRYESGMVGMALSGKDTGGSQWFVTLSPQPHLDGRYTIFARVTRGLEVARHVTQGTRVLRVEILK